MVFELPEPSRPADEPALARQPLRWAKTPSLSNCDGFPLTPALLVAPPAPPAPTVKLYNLAGDDSVGRLRGVLAAAACLAAFLCCCRRPPPPPAPQHSTYAEVTRPGRSRCRPRCWIR